MAKQHKAVKVLGPVDAPVAKAKIFTVKWFMVNAWIITYCVQ